MRKNNSYQRSFILALLLHIILFTFLFVKFATQHTYAISHKPQVNIVKAVAVDQAQVEKEIAQIKERKKHLQRRRAKAKRQAEIQKSIAQQVAAEQNQGEIDKYKALIIAAISQHWIIPENVAPNISCQLLVHVTANGVVTSVALLHSSGNPILDRSARTAVLQASPLPVPKGPVLINDFRVLKLTARPEGIT